MEEYRFIDASALGSMSTPPDPGPAPMLQWVEVKDLVVDPTYQRELTRPSLAHIGRIMASFAWAKFAPVIVAPIVGGRYAVIDGQHRATAALALGFDRVPAQVVIADKAVQAAAFAAVNGDTSRVHPVVAFHARATAGDPRAVEVLDVCADAGVKVIRFYRTASKLVRNETAAIAAIRGVIDRVGASTATHVLRCILASPCQEGGLLAGEIIRGTVHAVEVGAPNDIAPLSRDAHTKAFGLIDLMRERVEATAQARRERVSVVTVLADRLNDRLNEIAAQAWAAAPPPAQVPASPTVTGMSRDEVPPQAPGRDGLHWTAEEDARLTALVRAGEAPATIAAALGRRVGGIAWRMQDIGLTVEDLWRDGRPTAPPEAPGHPRFADVSPALLHAELRIIGRHLPPRPLPGSTGSAAAQCVE